MLTDTHAETRAIIELTGDVMEVRWFSWTRAAAVYKPKKMHKGILACCILHNMAMKRGLPASEDADAPEATWAGLPLTE